MAAGHDSHHAHAAPGPEDHGVHEDHGSGGDFWVVPPLVVGLVVGIAIIVLFGLQSGATAFS